MKTKRQRCGGQTWLQVPGFYATLEHLADIFMVKKGSGLQLKMKLHDVYILKQNLK